MGEKVMVDFPGFITRDSETLWLMVGNDSHVLLSNTVIAEMHRQLFAALGTRRPCASCTNPHGRALTSSRRTCPGPTT